MDCKGCGGGKLVEQMALARGMAVRVREVAYAIEDKDTAVCPVCGTNYKVIPVGVNRVGRRKLDRRARQ